MSASLAAGAAAQQPGRTAVLPPDDVQGAFARIPRHGEPIAAWTGDAIPSPEYTTRLDNRLGFRNHFQSVVRLGHSNVLAVSGSDARTRRSSVFLVRIGDTPGAALGPNLGAARRPPRHDAVVGVLELDADLWHAGGLAAYGSLLAVPVYGTDPLRARVVFFDAADPEAPRRLPVTIEREAKKAYAAALTRTLDGRYLTAVLSARDGEARRLDFYRSVSSDLLDGFEPRPVTWMAAEVKAAGGQDANFADFQNISLLQQSDGRLFLVGLHNTAPSMEALPGRDYADLFEVEFDRRDREPAVTKVANRHLVCVDGYCNLDAGAGIYVTPDGELIVYGAAFWLDGDRLKLTEFAPPEF